ncbi:SWR1-complex protein 5 [[Candida] jaroonii]|uniref:SWR1-complex protein 5 n=1 Tax=[Candida] jaroonii TaxID=467808 RepID=A0ACA9Y826_9ASCO|nr:SWR1-complex protein 5 [[Candida] jaroonii]
MELIASDINGSGKFDERSGSKGTNINKESHMEDTKKAEDDYDEEEDDDYDPTSIKEPVLSSDSEGEQDTPSEVTQVRTRRQRFEEVHQKKSSLVSEVNKDLNFDDIFRDLKTNSLSGKGAQIVDWDKEVEVEVAKTIENDVQVEQIDDKDKIWIKTSYTFAGKIITQSKQVDANSAEAKAYLNSTGLQMVDDQPHRSFVPVLRTPKGFEEPIELKIKLKRPSLIDKFLQTGNKKMKLSTLEKSRLDWASFVDENKLNDDLKIHNKGGYLEKQDFLGRLQAKRDENYEAARDADKARKLQEGNV